MKMFHHLTEAISSFLLYIREKYSEYKDLNNVSYLDDCKKTIYSFNSLSEKIKSYSIEYGSGNHITALRRKREIVNRKPRKKTVLKRS